MAREEPPPAGHPFWQRREIVLTPHISVQTVVREAIRQIAAKIDAGLEGAALSGVVDPARGH